MCGFIFPNPNPHPFSVLHSCFLSKYITCSSPPASLCPPYSFPFREAERTEAFVEALSRRVSFSIYCQINIGKWFQLRNWGF